MKPNRTREEIANDILNFFTNNEDIFSDCIEELDTCNGYLGESMCYPMNMFDSLYRDTEPSEILRRAFYGHDEDNFIIRNGNKIYPAFNPDRSYFRLDDNDNFISTDVRDYTGYLDHDLVENMFDCRRDICNIYKYEELAALFNELEKVGDAEENNS